MEIPVTACGDEFVKLSVEFPISPTPPEPQHFTVQSDIFAHEKLLWPPGKSLSAPDITVTGEYLAMTVPSPICPALLSPQHLTTPSESDTHEWFIPNATLATEPVSDATVYAVFMSPQVLPSAFTFPESLFPQHFSFPKLFTTQALLAVT